MYTYYKYTTSHTKATMLSDIVALLTGTTDKNLLSARCNKTSTVISAGYDPAGWALWDNAAGTNKKVLRAPCDGDPNQYKYLSIDTETYTNRVSFAMHEDWDPATHTGVNSIGEEQPVVIDYSTTQVGELFISCTNRRVIFNSKINGVANYACSLLEHNRELTPNYIGSGLVPMAFLSWSENLGNIVIVFTRFKQMNGIIYAAQGLPYTSVSIIGASIGSGLGGPVLEDGLRPIILSDFYFTNGVLYIPSFGVSGAKALIHTPSYALYDEFSYDGKTYVIMNLCTNHVNTAVPKG